MKILYKNSVVHNIIAHPIFEILWLIGLKRLGQIIHDKTVPDAWIN